MLFCCPACGLVHEPSGEGLRPVRALVAAVSSGVAVVPVEAYLAVWELCLQSDALRTGACSDSRGTEAGGDRLFVPAFSLARSVVEDLGVRLTRRRPHLEPAEASSQLPDPRLFSAIVLGPDDARALGSFVQTALQLDEAAGDSGTLPLEHCEREVVAQRLVFLPTVRDPRCIHDANWRLLLREFDDVVAG